MGIDGARFRRPVVPGDRLELEVEVLRRKGAVWKQQGKATVDGQVVAEAEFLAMLADPRAERSGGSHHGHPPHGHRHPGRRAAPELRGRPLRRHRPQVRMGPGNDGGPPRGDRGRHHHRRAATASSRSPSWAAIPQDLKYAGEATALDDRRREHHPRVRHRCTRHRGRRRRHPASATANLFMAYSHVAHDCQIGDGGILANRAALAGHVEVEDHVIFGGALGGAPVLPHRPARLRRRHDRRGAWTCRRTAPRRAPAPSWPGVNTVGLQRAGFAEEQIGRVKEAYKILFRSKLGLKEAHRRSSAPSSAATPRSTTSSSSSRARSAASRR